MYLQTNKKVSIRFDLVYYVSFDKNQTQLMFIVPISSKRFQVTLKFIDAREIGEKWENLRNFFSSGETLIHMRVGWVCEREIVCCQRVGVSVMHLPLLANQT